MVCRHRAGLSDLRKLDEEIKAVKQQIRVLAAQYAKAASEN